MSSWITELINQIKPFLERRFNSKCVFILSYENGLTFFMLSDDGSMKLYSKHTIDYPADYDPPPKVNPVEYESVNDCIDSLTFSGELDRTVRFYEPPFLDQILKAFQNKGLDIPQKLSNSL